jgi:hypothetical protein
LLEALGLIKFQEQENNVPIGFNFQMAKYELWKEFSNELHKQGFKIVKDDA